MSAEPVGNTTDMLREVASCDNLRFIMDLEFVESLARPDYLQYLSHSQVLQKESFLNYITYLQYFLRPEYSHFVQHVDALHFLEKLLLPQFRELLSQANFIGELNFFQEGSWRTFRAERELEVTPPAPAAAAGADADTDADHVAKRARAAPAAAAASTAPNPA